MGEVGEVEESQIPRSMAYSYESKNMALTFDYYYLMSVKGEISLSMDIFWQIVLKKNEGGGERWWRGRGCLSYLNTCMPLTNRALWLTTQCPSLIRKALKGALNKSGM